MSKSLSDRKIRLPVRYVGGSWELLTGGVLPVHPEAVGELLVDRDSIADPVFLENMDRKCHHKVLDEGTKLLVRMADRSWKDVSEEIRGVCKHAAHFWPFLGEALDPRTSGHCIFVEVSLGRPDRAQKELFETNSGGLWLLTQGPTPIGLASSQIVLPQVFGLEPVASLNHAYTALSEILESWRISHTGNIYRQVYYQEKNGKWFPLETLRSRTVDKTNAEIAARLWANFLTRMSPGRTGN